MTSFRKMKSSLPFFPMGTIFLRVVFSYCLTLRVTVITNELLLLLFFFFFYIIVCMYTREEEEEEVGRNTKTDVDYLNESINNIHSKQKLF